MRIYLIFLLMIPFTSGFEIEFLLEEVYVNVTYDKPFKVINLNESIQYNITFIYCVDEVCNTTTIPYINNYKTAKIAAIRLTKPGNFTLCAKIENKSCKDYEAKLPSACNITLSTSFEKFVYDSGEKVKFKHALDTDYPYLIEYHIEDLYGNIVKKRYNSSNTNTKSFTRDVEGESVFVLQSRVHSICQSEPIKDYFVVKGSQPELNTSIIIKEVKESCDVTYVHLDIYKGDTRKTVVEVKLKETRYVAQPVKFYLYEKNRGYELKVPLRITGSFTDPTLMVTGLGVDVSQELKLKCEGETAGSAAEEKEPELEITDIDYDCGQYVKVLFDLDKGTSRKRLVEVYIKDGRYLATERYKLYFNKSQKMLLALRLNRNYTDDMKLYFRGLVNANATLDFDCEIETCPICNLPPQMRPQVINHTCDYAEYRPEKGTGYLLYAYLGLICIITLFR